MIQTVDDSYNFILEGDNLQSLYLLKKTHKKSIDLIYIDPPYNTEKSFFTYDDCMVDVNDYYRHSKWISFMNRRLKIAKDLLSKKGVIFISIDNSELYNLKLLCDEIFGESNFVGNIIWRTATDNNITQITTEHEYILCYARNKEDLDKWYGSSESAELIQNKYLELKEEYGDDYEKIQKLLKKWTKQNESDLPQAAHYNYVDEQGVFYPGNSSNTKDGSYKYEIIHPVTGKACAMPTFGYRWPKYSFDEAAARGDVMWGDDETTIPKIKKRLETAKTGLKAYYYEDNRSANLNLERIFEEKDRFSNPKSTKLLERLISFAAEKDAVILDFFAGSGSTGEAVLRLNHKDGGRRRFILCTNNEISLWNKVRYIHSKGLMEDYTPDGHAKPQSIESKISKFFSDKNELYDELFKSEEGAKEYDLYGICKFVTYPRIKAVITGLSVNGNQLNESFPANLKYYKCSWIDRYPLNHSLNSELIKHIKEMIELKYGINIDQSTHVVITSYSDYEKTVNDPSIVANIKHIWVNEKILVRFNNEEISKMKQIGMTYIPREFFSQELKEVAE